MAGPVVNGTPIFHSRISYRHGAMLMGMFLRELPLFPGGLRDRGRQKKRPRYFCPIRAILLLIVCLFFDVPAQGQGRNICMAEFPDCDKRVKVLCGLDGKPLLLNSGRVHRLIVTKTSITPPGTLGHTNLKGSVTVSILLDEKGKILCIRALRGHPIAQNSVVASIYKWKFKPYKYKSKSVPVAGVLTVNYDFRK